MFRLPRQCRDRWHLQTAPIAVVPNMQTRASCELVITPATLSPLRTPDDRNARAHLSTKEHRGRKRHWMVRYGQELMLSHVRGRANDRQESRVVRFRCGERVNVKRLRSEERIALAGPTPSPRNRPDDSMSRSASPEQRVIVA